MSTGVEVEGGLESAVGAEHDAMVADPELLRVVEILRGIEDRDVGDGEVECPICETTMSLGSLSPHASSVHEESIPEAELGADHWRDVLQVCYSEQGMSPYRIAGYIPASVGYRLVATDIAKYGLERADRPYGEGRAQHPDDPFEQLVRDTLAAVRDCLTDPLTATVATRDVVREMDPGIKRVAQAMRELKRRGVLRPVNASTPYRWALVDDRDGGGDG